MIDSVYDWRWILFALLAAAAVSDMRSLRIPNAFPLTVAAVLAALLAATSAPAEEWAAAALSGLIGLGVGYALFALGLMGGGDGKLFAAAAAWFGPSALLGVGFYVSLAGVVIALAALAARSLGPAPPPPGGAVKAALKTPIPYGVAIAAGVVAAAQLPIFE